MLLLDRPSPRFDSAVAEFVEHCADIRQVAFPQVRFAKEESVLFLSVACILDCCLQEFLLCRRCCHESRTFCCLIIVRSLSFLSISTLSEIYRISAAKEIETFRMIGLVFEGGNTVKLSRTPTQRKAPVEPLNVSTLTLPEWIEINCHFKH